MRRLAWKSWIIGTLTLGMLVLGELGRAEPPGPSAQGAQAAWSPKFYGFCVGTHDTKKRTIPQQAQMLRQLGSILRVV